MPTSLFEHISMGQAFNPSTFPLHQCGHRMCVSAEGLCCLLKLAHAPGARFPLLALCAAETWIQTIGDNFCFKITAHHVCLNVCFTHRRATSPNNQKRRVKGENLEVADLLDTTKARFLKSPEKTEKTKTCLEFITHAPGVRESKDQRTITAQSNLSNETGRLKLAQTAIHTRANVSPCKFSAYAKTSKLFHAVLFSDSFEKQCAVPLKMGLPL